MRVCYTCPDLLLQCVITDTRKKPFLLKINVAEGWGCLSLPSWVPAIWNRSSVFVKTWAKPKLVSGDQWGLEVIFVKLWGKFHEAKKDLGHTSVRKWDPEIILAQKTFSKHEENLPAILELLTKTNCNQQLKLPNAFFFSHRSSLKLKDYPHSFFFNISTFNLVSSDLSSTVLWLFFWHCICVPEGPEDRKQEQRT